MLQKLIHGMAYRMLGWPKVDIEARKLATKLVMANKCSCGSGKMPGHAFCTPCFKALPLYRRRQLTMKLRRGFVRAYLEVLQGRK